MEPTRPIVNAMMLPWRAAHFGTFARFKTTAQHGRGNLGMIR
jgi:hypothetical protein